MKVRAVLEVTGVQHLRSGGRAQTRVTMVGGGVEQLELTWTIPEWTPIAKGMSFEVDISRVWGRAEAEREREQAP